MHFNFMHQLHKACGHCCTKSSFMAMRPSHCTMRDIGEHLGISHATVSRALRNDPRITEAVRIKVVKAANKLGYKRDPKLAQLMSHMRASKERAFQGTLAWVTDHDLAVEAELAPHLLYWESASKRASELGYHLECFPKTCPSDSTKIERKLRAQGIQGVIIQQFKEAFHLPSWKFNWQRFAVIHNGSCQTQLCLDSVDADDIGNCVQLFGKLRSLGYLRIGICTTRAIEVATNFSLCTAWHRYRLLGSNTPEIPPLLLPDLGGASAEAVAVWLRQHDVDVVVSQVRGMKELLESIGRRVPDDVGLTYQGVNPHGTNSGIWQREDLVARVIIESVIASVEQGRFGLPEAPRISMIQGSWHQGVTCRGESH